MTTKKKNSSHSRRFHLSIEIKAVLFIIFGIFFLASTTGFILLALKYFNNPDIIHTDKAYIIIIRTVILYFFIAGAIYLIRLLWERLTGEFFSNIIAILAAVILSGEILQAVIKYFLGAYNDIWLRILLVFSLLSFGYLFTAIIGFFPMYTHQLKESMRKNLLYRETSGYTKLHYGAYYKVDVLKVDYIPQSIDRFHGSVEKDMKKALRRFVSRHWRLKKHSKRFILIGGFGSGKTTALQEVVEAKLKHTFLHNGGIPVYVSLRDWLKDDTDLSKVRSNKKVLTERTQHSDLFEKLFRLVTGDDKKTNTDDPLWNVFLKLHDDRRLIYVFDGLNELLQRNVGDNDRQNQQYARNIAAFLYYFASGNRCIISMCELQNVLTTQSICIDDKDQYEMYAVKGVHLNKKQTERLQENKWMEKLIPYVALYRLAEKNLDDGEEAKSTYSLLHKYVEDQLKRELISPDDLSHCVEAVRKAIKTTANLCYFGGEVKDSFVHSPYSGLQIDDADREWFQYLCDARLFYIDVQKSDSKPEYTEYHASHILYHEFFLAECAYNLFFSKTEDSVEKVDFSKKILFCGNCFNAFFCGSASDHKPNFLEYSYLRSVFSMVITEAILASSANAVWGYLNKIYNWINTNSSNDMDRKKYLRKYLVLLSQINDDLSNLSSDHKYDISSFLTDNPQIKDEVSQICIDKAIDISERFALAKILPDQSTKNNVISGILEDVLKEKWTYLSVQREVLLYYTESLKQSGSEESKEEKGE